MSKQSRSDEGKSYRERQIAAIGADEWKRRERERKRRSRARAKGIISEPKKTEDSTPKKQPKVKKVSKTEDSTPKKQPKVKKTEDSTPGTFGKLVTQIFKVKSKLAKASGKTITEGTIRAQLTKVLTLKKRMGIKSHMADFTFLKKRQDVLSSLKNQPQLKTENSRIAYLSAIASVLITLKGFNSDYKFYSALSTLKRGVVTEKSDDNKLTEKEKVNYLTWSKLKTIHMKAENLKDKAILAITTLLPPRRVKAYQFLTVSTRKIKKYLNYVKLDANGKPRAIIYQTYKTAKTYGKQTIPIPSNLSKILKLYIESENLKDGDPLFGKGEKYVSNFTPVLTAIYEKYTGKSISSNILRHSYISDFLGKPRSTNQKKFIARQMGHSVNQQQSYLRL